nr:unnamed protein product [Digitaria exilis]
MSLAAFFVFLVVSALQLVDRYLDLARKVSADLPPASLSRVAPPIRLVASRPGSPRGSQSDEQIKLRLEIKELLKEANQLSTPSTFAQAAKLKRLAAAKEKELAKRKMLSWRGVDSATGHVVVGILPWLFLTSRVSKLLCQKFSFVLLRP